MFYMKGNTVKPNPKKLKSARRKEIGKKNGTWHKAKATHKAEYVDISRVLPDGRIMHKSKLMVHAI